MFKLTSLFALICAVTVAGCMPGEAVDSHTSAVIVEKIEPTDSVDYGIIRAVTTGEPPQLVAFSLTEDSSRPLAYIWANLKIGSNVAFQSLNSNGQPRHHPDGIFSLSTAEFVLLDKPDDLEAVIKLAQSKKRVELLERQAQRVALNKVWHQAHMPKE